MIYYQYSNFSQITLVKSSGPKEWENAWEPWNFKLLAHRPEKLSWRQIQINQS